MIAKAPVLLLTVNPLLINIAVKELNPVLFNLTPLAETKIRESRFRIHQTKVKRPRMRIYASILRDQEKLTRQKWAREREPRRTKWPLKSSPQILNQTSKKLAKEVEIPSVQEANWGPISIRLILLRLQVDARSQDFYTTPNLLIWLKICNRAPLSRILLWPQREIHLEIILNCFQAKIWL